MHEVALPVLAVVAGLVSFTSPCTLPLVPGYLSYVSALPVSRLGERGSRRVALRASVLFVAGFAVAFSFLGVAAAFLGSVLLGDLPVIVRVAGVGIIVLGLVMAARVRMPGVTREWRVDPRRVGAGPRAAFALGVAFALGWTPCVGPVLATILATAAATGTAWWGGVLLALYAAGLGLPFVALALGFQRARRSVAWLRRHGRGVELAGAALLVAVGVAFVSGLWRDLFVPLQAHVAAWGWPPI